MAFCDQASGCDLVFFPEIQLSPFFPQYPHFCAAAYCLELHDSAIRQLQQKAKEHRYYLSPNVYLHLNGKKYDSSLWITPDGEIADIAKMVHIAQNKNFYEQDYYAPSESDEEQTSLLEQMGKFQEQLDYFEQYEAEYILWNLIEKMQIDPVLLDQRMEELSGGQKSKMAFARVLFSKPEILCLDEPTNHLDAGTKDFVTEYLKNYKGTVLIISHDIDFLNQIINKILYINKSTHKISVYEGDYTAYQKKYAEEKRAKELMIAQQEREIKELSDFVQRANQASQTNHAIKRMGQERALRLEKRRKELITRDRPYKRVKMDIKPQREGAQTPLEVENLTFHYPGQPNLYEDLTFRSAAASFIQKQKSFPAQKKTCKQTTCRSFNMVHHRGLSRGLTNTALWCWLPPAGGRPVLVHAANQKIAPDPKIGGIFWCTISGSVKKTVQCTVFSERSPRGECKLHSSAA